MKKKTILSFLLLVVSFTLFAQTPRILYRSHRVMPSDSVLFDVYALMYQHQNDFAEQKYDSICSVYLASHNLNDYLFLNNEYTYWLRLFGGNPSVSEDLLKTSVDTVLALGGAKDFEMLYAYYNMQLHATNLHSKVANGEAFFQLYNVLFPNDELLNMNVSVHLLNGYAYYHMNNIPKLWEHWDYCLAHLEDLNDPYWVLRKMGAIIKMSQPETALTISQYVHQNLMERPGNWQKKFTTTGDFLVLLNRVEDYDEAVKYGIEGVAFFEEHFEDIRRGMRPHAVIHFALVDAYISTGQYDKAFDVMDKVYAMIDDLGYRGQTISYMEDAKKRCFSKNGMLDSALVYLKRTYAIDLVEKTDPQYLAANYMDNSIAGDLEQFGNYNFVNQQYDSALWYYRRALRASNMKFYEHIEEEDYLIPPSEFRGVSVSSAMRTMDRLLNAYVAYYEADNDSSILYTILDYCKYGNAILKDQFATLVDEQAVLATSEMIKTNSSYALYACNALAKSNPQYVDSAFIYADQSRSFSLSYLKQLKNRPMSSVEDSLMTEVSRLSIALANYPKTDSIDAGLVDITLKSLRTKMLLEQVNTAEAPLVDFSSDVNLLKKSLANDEAVIEYFVDDTVVYATCYTQNSELMSRVAFPDLPSRVKAFKRSVKSAAFDKAVAHLFYQKLMAPFELVLQGVSKISVVIDEHLNETPFELFVDTTGNFLVQKYAFQYYYSAKMFGKTIPHPINSILAIAPGFQKNNTFFADNVMRSLIDSSQMFDLREAAASLAPLTYSLSEVEAIEKECSKMKISSEVMEATEATETAFKSTAKHHSILHIATHGVSAAEGQSGLFFSYDEDLKDDGFLRLPELYSMNLDVDLVVLSACKTAIGDVKSGEGVIALPRGFIYAGVPNVIASLWKVHDERTKYLMVQFYKHLLGGDLTYAKALQKAKLDCIAKGYRPLDWSGFVLISE